MRHNDVGKLGEDAAAKFLTKNGYKILERNIHISHNEIDIIAKNKSFLVFAEVKTRTVGEDLYSEYGTPASAVTKQKQMRIITAARAYLRMNNYNDLQPRLDVIEVYVDKASGKISKINHFEDAFWA